MNMFTGLIAVPSSLLLFSLSLLACSPSDTAGTADLAGPALRPSEGELDVTFERGGSLATFEEATHAHAWTEVVIEGDLVFSEDAAIDTWLAQRGTDHAGGPVHLRASGTIAVLRDVTVRSAVPLYLEAQTIDIDEGGYINVAGDLYVKAHQWLGPGGVGAVGSTHEGEDGDDGADGDDASCFASTWHVVPPTPGADGLRGGKGIMTRAAANIQVMVRRLENGPRIDAIGSRGSKGGNGGRGGRGGDGVACDLDHCSDGAHGGSGGDGGEGGDGGDGGNVKIFFCTATATPRVNTSGGQPGDGGHGGPGGPGGSAAGSCGAGGPGSTGKAGVPGWWGGPGALTLVQLRSQDCR